LEGVDDGFALEVIVGDDEGVAGVLGDFVDAGGPGSELFLRVEIVVALVGGDGGIFGEPGVVAAAVETDVTDGTSGLRRGSERAADNGLVDVAEAGVVFAEERESFGGIPRGVADFDDEGIVGEAFENGGKIGDGFLGAMEGKRELEEDGTEFVGGAENVKAGADEALVFGGGARVVSEFLPEFGGEEEARIGGDAFEPVGGVVGAERMVEGGVDFDGVEEGGEIFGFVETFGAGRGIDVAGPIGVGPAGRADAERGGAPGIGRGVGLARLYGRLRFAWGHEVGGAKCAGSRVEGRERECQRARAGELWVVDEAVGGRTRVGRAAVVLCKVECRFRGGELNNEDV
jgi:hypothetical protein